MNRGIYPSTYESIGIMPTMTTTTSQTVIQISEKSSKNRLYGNFYTSKAGFKKQECVKILKSILI